MVDISGAHDEGPEPAVPPAPRGYANWLIGGLSAILLIGVGTIVGEQISASRTMTALSERESAATARLQGEIDVLMAEHAGLERQVQYNTGRVDQIEKALEGLKERVESIRALQLRGGVGR